MRTFVTILTILIFEFANGQDCKQKLFDYYSNIDTTKRPVYLMVDSMPDLFKNGEIIRFMSEKISEINNNCCPIYIWYGFVIEPDSSFSNILICPQLELCSDTIDYDKNTQLFIDKLTEKVQQSKTSTGLLKEKKVAVTSYGRIHFECQ